MKPRYPSRRPTSLPLNQVLMASTVLATLLGPTVAQGPRQFAELPRTGTPVYGDFTRAVALGDVDGDGDLDLVTGNAVQTRLYVNDGTGRFSDLTSSQLPVDSGSTSSVALGDVDGDGDLDAVIGNSGQNNLYLNDGTGTFSDATAGQLPVDNDPTSSVLLGDVDSDGDLDLVIANGAAQQNRLYLNDGTGTFTDATAGRMPVDSDMTFSAALGDVDGDGDGDMVIGNGSGQNRLYLNDGTGTFSDATTNKMPIDMNSAQSVFLVDVDGDADADMVIGNAGPLAGEQNRLYVNDGTGTFTDATASQMPVRSDMTRSVALGDVDGDGDGDMVIGNGFGQNRLYLNDGTGTFSDATTTRMPVDGDLTFSVALGDVDGDGDLDAVIGNGSFPTFHPDRVYLNLQRQLHAPSAPQLGQPYTLDAYLRYGPSSPVDLAAIYLSTGSASIALPPFGTLGIDPAMAAPFPTLVIPQPAGVGTVGFTLPNMAGLIGQEIYSQALLVAYPIDLRLSNVVRDVIQ